MLTSTTALLLAQQLAVDRGSITRLDADARGLTDKLQQVHELRDTIAARRDQLIDQLDALYPTWDEEFAHLF